MAAPSGTVTFLFTDIEGSTRLWEQAPTAMRDALELHDRIVQAAIAEHAGYVFATGGDGFAAAFGRAGDGVAASARAQAKLSGGDWPAAAPVRVRMALHTGEASERDGNYFGSAVNRAARLMAVGHGGQLLVSAVTAELSRTSSSLTWASTASGTWLRQCGYSRSGLGRSLRSDRWTSCQGTSLRW